MLECRVRRGEQWETSKEKERREDWGEGKSEAYEVHVVGGERFVQEDDLRADCDDDGDENDVREPEGPRVDVARIFDNRALQRDSAKSHAIRIIMGGVFRT